MNEDPKTPEPKQTADSDELDAEDLEQVAGGYAYELENVLISSYSVGGAGGDAPPGDPGNGLSLRKRPGRAK